MYPTFSDLLKDLFGFHLPLPIQTFGFFVALAFLAGAWLLSMELKRRERLGWVSPVYETRKVDDTSKIFKLLSDGSLGFFIGYKLWYIFLHWAMFAMDAPTVLASSKGNLAGGLVVGVLILVLKYRDKKNKASANVKETREVVWPIKGLALSLALQLFGDLQEQNCLTVWKTGTAIWKIPGTVSYLLAD